MYFKQGKNMNGNFRRALCALVLLGCSGAALALDTVSVTIYKEGSFTRQWGNQADAVAQRMFDDTARFYRDNFGITMTLNRIDTAFFNSESQVSGVPTDSRTILFTMRQNLRQTNGQFLSVLPSNWLLIHRDVRVQGEVDGLGNLSHVYPNLYINTRQPALSDGIFITEICPGEPARRRTTAEMRYTAIHEFGHLLSATHTTPAACTNSMMCGPTANSCGGGGVWNKGTHATNGMDATSVARINAHKNCYMTANAGRWLDCFRRGVHR